MPRGASRACLDPRPAISYPFWAMKRIAGVLHVERRVSPRHAVRVRVLYVLGGCVFDAQTIDISEHGMCLQTDLAIEVGTQVLLYFTPYDDVTARRIEAEVMWSEPVAGKREAFQAGLRFAAVSREVLTDIREVIAARADGRLETDLPEVSPDDVVTVEAQPPEPTPPPLSDSLHFALGRDRKERAKARAKGETLMREAQEAAARGDLDLAKACLEQVMVNLPDSVEAVEELARITYLRGDVVGAAALFDRALRIRQETK